MASVVVSVSLLSAGSALTAPNPAIPPQVDWTQLLTLDQHTTLLQDLHAAYPGITKLFSIGRTWQERDIWALELTSPIQAQPTKPGVVMFGNIHGGEQQSAMGAAYTAWWLATQYGNDATATNVLKKYVVYVVPLINPDGYLLSFTSSTRQNMRPTDRNGIRGPLQ